MQTSANKLTFQSLRYNLKAHCGSIATSFQRARIDSTYYETPNLTTTTYFSPHEKKKAITVFRPRSSPVAAAISRPVVTTMYPPQVTVARAAPGYTEVRK